VAGKSYSSRVYEQRAQSRCFILDAQAMDTPSNAQHGSKKTRIHFLWYFSDG